MAAPKASVEPPANPMTIRAAKRLLNDGDNADQMFVTVNISKARMKTGLLPR